MRALTLLLLLLSACNDQTPQIENSIEVNRGVDFSESTVPQEDTEDSSVYSCNLCENQEECGPFKRPSKCVACCSAINCVSVCDGGSGNNQSPPSCIYDNPNPYLPPTCSAGSPGCTTN